MSPAALPDMEGWTRFARCAEEAGIESVLLSFSRYEPDTIFVRVAHGPGDDETKVHRRVSPGPDAARDVRASKSTRCQALIKVDA
jgi:hypothetical protein